MGKVTAGKTAGNLPAIYNRLDERHKRLAKVLIKGLLVLQNSDEDSAINGGTADVSFEPKLPRQLHRDR